MLQRGGTLKKTVNDTCKIKRMKRETYGLWKGWNGYKLTDKHTNGGWRHSERGIETGLQETENKSLTLTLRAVVEGKEVRGRHNKL